MGKVSKAGKISKALVKKGISKSTTSTVVATEPNQLPQLVNEVPSKARLTQLSSMIATGAISRGQRKRAMKRARLESRKAFTASAISAKKTADNLSGFGAGLGNFDEMVEAIDDTCTTDTPTPVLKKSSKWMSGALKKGKKAQSDRVDISRVQTLLSIPDFSSDPMAAMEKHLLGLKNRREEKASTNVSRMEVS